MLTAAEQPNAHCDSTSPTDWVNAHVARYHRSRQVVYALNQSLCITSENLRVRQEEKP